MLSSRLKYFFKDTSMPKSVFCRKCDISTTTLYRFLNDDLKLSEETEHRIDEYLFRWGY